MTAETYLYPGTSGQAALHLLDHSALADCTERKNVGTADCRACGGRGIRLHGWAVCTTTCRDCSGSGRTADSIRVRQSWPLSSGEALLWSALDSLARGGGAVDLGACAAVLDADNLRVLWEALGMAFGVAAVVS